MSRFEKLPTKVFTECTQQISTLNADITKKLHEIAPSKRIVTHRDLSHELVAHVRSGNYTNLIKLFLRSGNCTSVDHGRMQFNDTNNVTWEAICYEFIIDVSGVHVGGSDTVILKDMKFAKELRTILKNAVAHCATKIKAGVQCPFLFSETLQFTKKCLTGNLAYLNSDGILGKNIGWIPAKPAIINILESRAALVHNGMILCIRVSFAGIKNLDFENLDFESGSSTCENIFLGYCEPMMITENGLILMKENGEETPVASMSTPTSGKGHVSGSARKVPLGGFRVMADAFQELNRRADERRAAREGARTSAATAAAQQRQQNDEGKSPNSSIDHAAQQDVTPEGSGDESEYEAVARSLQKFKNKLKSRRGEGSPAP